jgi:putative addiction module component (TIGR02574 family)
MGKPLVLRPCKLQEELSEVAMSTLVEELSARAKTLPAEDRARLAEEMLDSLQEESDAEAGNSWDREIERRVAEIESGAELISAEEVHAEARRLIRR